MKLINNLIIQIIPFLPKFFVKLVASPYIAGITDEEMLKIVPKSKNFKESRDQIIKLINEINWQHGFFRKDIGYKVIEQ